VVATLEQARQIAVDDANIAKASSRKSDFEALWVWLGRVGVGWNLHRAIEDFVVALREVVPGEHSQPTEVGPKEGPNGSDLADNQRGRASTLRSTLISLRAGIDKIAKAADATTLAAGAALDLVERVDVLAKRNETYNLISAVLNRYVIGNLTIRILLWSIPTIILFGEFLGLERHNDTLETEIRLLQKQIDTQRRLSVEERDIEYLKLITCDRAGGAGCPGPEIRRRAYLLFAQDQKISSGGSMILFQDIVLSDVKFGGEFPVPIGGWPGFGNAYFRGGRFERMDLRLSEIKDAIFSDSTFTRQI
jgi:hypothetical protein